jgi:flavin reductase (DIM6/NTAB) family NADH-FMN oxidoreductase RutF
MTVPIHSLDPDTFRAAMGCFLTGVTIVTSVGGSGMTGLTANSFTSVSLDPCKVLVCIKSRSATGLTIRESAKFAVNFLSAGQGDLAWRFAKPCDDRFAGIDFACDKNGLPLLAGSLAHIVCALDCIHESGDHDIFIGDVLACSSASGKPLAFFRGQMCEYATHTN